MIKRIYPVLAALVVAIALAGPVHAAPSSPQLVQRAEVVARASNAAGIWHRPHRGYLVQDRRQMHTGLVPRLHVSLSHCHRDARCKAMTRAYYASLHHQWRVLNRSLWTLVAGLPRCSEAIATNCATHDGALTLGQWWFVANQRAVFLS